MVNSIYTVSDQVTVANGAVTNYNFALNNIGERFNVKRIILAYSAKQNAANVWVNFSQETKAFVEMFIQPQFAAAQSFEQVLPNTGNRSDGKVIRICQQGVYDFDKLAVNSTLNYYVLLNNYTGFDLVFTITVTTEIEGRK